MNNFFESLIDTSLEFIDRIGEKIYEETWNGRLEKELQKLGYKTKHNQIYLPPKHFLDRPEYKDIIEILYEKKRIVIVPFPDFRKYYWITKETYDCDKRIMLTIDRRIGEVYPRHIFISGLSLGEIAKEIDRKIKKRKKLNNSF